MTRAQRANRVAAAAVLLTTSLAVAGCDNGNNCESICQGCCSGGQCLSGTDPTARGAGGASCVSCGGGQSCQSGLCVSTPCVGCTQDGKCYTAADQDSSRCGGYGTPCEQCDGPCQVGIGCETAVCGGASCAGCCDGNFCVPFANQDSTACGGLGEPCADCPMNQYCSPTTHECTLGSPPCDIPDCMVAGQCCDRKTNTCVLGLFRTNYCGTGGQDCVDCAQLGFSGCDGYGQCANN